MRRTRFRPSFSINLSNLPVRTIVPVAMHLAESREELDLLRDGTGPFQDLLDERSMWDPQAIPLGSRPLDYLRMLADAPRALVIHGNYLDDEELAFLGANRERMSLVYCPRTHAYFFHPPYPLGRALAAGVHVALGTDSRASNPDLSLLEEMRFVCAPILQLAPPRYCTWERWLEPRRWVGMIKWAASRLANLQTWSPCRYRTMQVAGPKSYYGGFSPMTRHRRRFT